MEGLAPLDAWVIAAIAAKAVGYLAAFLAMGGPLFVVLMRDVPTEFKRLTIRVAAVAAALGLIIVAARFGIRAARISGMGWAGTVDPMMLGFVWDSPLGTAAIWRVAGFALVLLGAALGPRRSVVGVIGALLIAISFTQIGHALGDPRPVLAALLAGHVLAVSFWVAALVPLRALAGQGALAGPVLHRFGQIAGIAVLLLVIAGGIFATLMTGSIAALFTTAYGWTLLAKLGLVCGLLGLAAANKWRFVPALTAEEPRAIQHLRRSILLEGVVVLLILIATATLTAVTTPPVNM